MATTTTVSVPVDDPYPHLTSMLRDLSTMIEVEESMDGGGDTFVMDLMERILSAETVDEVFEAQTGGIISGQDFAGKPFIVMDDDDITWKKSTKVNVDQNGFPLYAILNVVEYGGDERVIACGGRTFVAVLRSLQLKGYFDRDKYPHGQSLIINSTATAAGAYLSLQPFKRPVVGEQSNANARKSR